MLSVRQVAAMAAVNEQAVRRQIRRQKLTAVKQQGRLLVARAEAEAYASEQERLRSILPPSDWYWEGHVVDRLVAWLTSQQGWNVIRVAKTGSRERGADVLAVRGDSRLRLEVKGYPTPDYRDPSRAGEIKRTKPATQARHWYSQLLLAAMLAHHSDTGQEQAIVLPDMSVYRGLLERTRQALKHLGIGVYLVTENGSVIGYLEHRPIGW